MSKYHGLIYLIFVLSLLPFVTHAASIDADVNRQSNIIEQVSDLGTEAETDRVDVKTVAFRSAVINALGYLAYSVFENDVIVTEELADDVEIVAKSIEGTIGQIRVNVVSRTRNKYPFEEKIFVRGSLGPGTSALEFSWDKFRVESNNSTVDLLALLSLSNVTVDTVRYLDVNECLSESERCTVFVKLRTNIRGKNYVEEANGFYRPN